MTYSASGSTLMAVLAGDLEGDIVGGVALDLEGAGGQVVEVLVEQLWDGLLVLCAAIERFLPSSSPPKARVRPGSKS